ncbi:DUF559 domain-containing protein [Brevibacillus porteri]|uniref:DUF559 domain-containing protein n=1 Tax=Brevibacillus porteri TaxID=2126350 RepID=UPI00370BE460
MAKKTKEQLFIEYWNIFFGSRAKFDAFYDKYKYWNDKLGSPIEADLNELLRNYFSGNPLSQDLEMILQCNIVIHDKKTVKINGEEYMDEKLGVRNSYYLDFAFLYKGRPLLNIECDGEDFHTEFQQVVSDRHRDEQLKSIGFAVIRFTGKQIKNEEYGQLIIHHISNDLEYLMKLRDLDEEYRDRATELFKSYGPSSGADFGRSNLDLKLPYTYIE